MDDGHWCSRDDGCPKGLSNNHFGTRRPQDLKFDVFSGRGAGGGAVRVRGRAGRTHPACCTLVYCRGVGGRSQNPRIEILGVETDEMTDTPRPPKLITYHDYVYGIMSCVVCLEYLSVVGATCARRELVLLLCLR